MQIGIVGLGLIGGSFARLIKKTGSGKVYAFDLSEEVMKKGELLKAYDEVLTEDNVGNVDMLIFAVYPSAFKPAAERFLPYLKDGAVITDFCGTKKRVIGDMKILAEKYPRLNFIGGHPMAGREFSGIEHSAVNLFDKASMILVNVNADIYVLQKIKNFYLSLGFGEVVITTAENHDRNIAYTSQLCHVVSNAYIKNSVAEEHFGYSAGSYKDLTRVARLSPEMWAGLMTENRENLLVQLNELIDNLKKYSDALKDGDGKRLFELLKEGSDRKTAIDSRNARKKDKVEK